MNIILISIDCLRADYVGYTDDAKHKMPNLCKMVENGQAYSHCIVPAPFTTVSHASMLTGLYPFSHGIRHLWGERLFSEKMIQHKLKDDGYDTHAIVSCFHMSHIGIESGFDTFQYNPCVIKDKYGRGDYNLAEVVTDRAIRILSGEKYDQNFLFLHYFDAHVHARCEYEVMYKEMLSYIDEEIQRLVDYCSGYKKETLFVITGDHGKKWNGEHNFPCLNPRNQELDPKPCLYDDEGEGGHGAELYDESVKVPLILYAPSIISPCKIVHTAFSSTKIPVMIECAVNHQDFKESINPLIYMETFSPDQLFKQGIPLIGLRSNEWKLICYQMGINNNGRRLFAPAELYYLVDDPKEENNVLDSNAVVAETLFGVIKDLFKCSFAESQIKEEQIKQKLSELGYI